MSRNKTHASLMWKFTRLIPPGSEEKLAADVGRIKPPLQGGTFACPSPRDTHMSHTHATLGCRSLAKAPKTHPFWCQPSAQLKPPQILEYPHGPPESECLPASVALSFFLSFQGLQRTAELRATEPGLHLLLYSTGSLSNFLPQTMDISSTAE